MIRFALLASTFIVAASTAAAQELTVRSGEHDGYTRLVVQIPHDTGWVLKQSKNGARLSVALKDAIFQTGSVFQRLNTDRLATLSQSEAGAALEMEFGCECTATAFLFKDTMIVIDIAPGTFLPPITSDVPPPALPKPPIKSNPLSATQSLDALEIPLLSFNASGLEEQLSTRLLQGADRDIVDLKVAPLGPRASAIELNTLVPSGLEQNINVTSILDGLNGLLGPNIPQLVQQPKCVSNRELAFADWSDHRPFHVQTAELRSGLFQEFDAIDADQALKLAKLYAYSGFGAEAKQALDLLDKKTAETDRISAIALFLDKGLAPDKNPFANLQRCESDAALWAALTESRLRDNAYLIAIEQSFARLPDHLRRHVGPTLSNILVEAEELEAARRILRSVDRVEPQTSPSTTQAKAKVAHAEGNASKTEALLTNVISASDAALEAPLALARLVEKRWTERGAISPQELRLAESYTVEFRRSDIGPLMQRTQAVALSLGQEFDAAMDLATNLSLEVDDAETLNRVTLVLTERADDTTFLRRVLSLPPQPSQALATETAIAVADRLASIGFSRHALFLAKRPQDRIKRGERARIRAKAALLDERPHQAILELSDDQSEAAVSLRAQALQTVGDFSAAGELVRAKGDEDTANRMFWLADLPNEASDKSDSKYGNLAKTTQALTNLPTRLPETPLADAAQLLQDSEDMRQSIVDLFAVLEQK